MAVGLYRRCFAFAVLLSVGGTAWAQSEGALSEVEVRSCFCQERAIEELRQEAEVRRLLRDERESELQRLVRTIASERAVMDPESPIDQNNLKALLARQQRLREILRYDVRRAEVDTITSLNAAVDRYNAQCTVRPMLKSTVAKVRAELDLSGCP